MTLNYHLTSHHIELSHLTFQNATVTIADPRLPGALRGLRETLASVAQASSAAVAPAEGQALMAPGLGGTENGGESTAPPANNG